MDLHTNDITVEYGEAHTSPPRPSVKAGPVSVPPEKLELTRRLYGILFSVFSPITKL